GTQDTTDGTRATTNGTQDITDGTRATTNGMQDTTAGTLATTNGTPTLTNGSTNCTLTTTTEAATDGTQVPAADRIVDGTAQSTFAQPAPAPARLLGWQDTTRLPWGILLLFGGGLALAAAISSSGLAAAIGALFSNMDTVEIFLVVAIIATVVVFLTELTSNLATTATFLPVVAAVALQFGVDPMVFVVPVALAASCAFMLPVATPPNAIVFSSGMIRIPQMARAGLLLNACAIVIVSVVSMVLVPAVLVAVN
nr:anion permease [Pseudomonadota bacterium]